MLTADLLFEAKVVNLILSKDAEGALELLTQRYEVAKPNLKVGMPKRHSKNRSVTSQRNERFTFLIGRFFVIQRCVGRHREVCPEICGELFTSLQNKCSVYARATNRAYIS
jgi:hypothetical protein